MRDWECGVGRVWSWSGPGLIPGTDGHKAQYNAGLRFQPSRSDFFSGFGKSRSLRSYGVLFFGPKLIQRKLDMACIDQLSHGYQDYS